VFGAPTFSFDANGLTLGSPAAVSPSGRLGFFETRGTIRFPSAGTYRLVFNLLPSSPTPVGKRHPEIQIRVFSPDDLYQRFASTAGTALSPLRREIPVYVGVGSGDGLKVAIDLLSFTSDIEGSVTVTSITSTKVN